MKDNLRVHGLDKQHFIFIIHGHHDEQFSVAATKVLSERISGGHKIVGITGSCRISHLGELFDIAFAWRRDMGRHWDIQYEVSTEKLHLFYRSTLHEFFPHDRPASGTAAISIHSWTWRILLWLFYEMWTLSISLMWNLRNWRGKTNLGHLIWVEMGLWTGITTLVWFWVPIRVWVFARSRTVVAGNTSVTNGRRRRSIDSIIVLLRLLLIWWVSLLLTGTKRIVVLAISHILTRIEGDKKKDYRWSKRRGVKDVVNAWSKSTNHVEIFDPHLVKQFSLVCFSHFTQARCKMKRQSTFLLFTNHCHCPWPVLLYKIYCPWSWNSGGGAWVVKKKE